MPGQPLDPWPGTVAWQSHAHGGARQGTFAGEAVGIRQAWAEKPRLVCGVGKGVPWVFCFSFRGGCTLSRTGTGALAWRRLSPQEGAQVSCELGVPVLCASHRQAQRQVSPEGGRQEGASPHSLACCTDVPPRFGVSHPRGHLGVCPGCCGHDHLLPRACVPETGLCTRRWVRCCPSLPPLKDVPLSASPAPIAIATGSALGYPRCRLPHPVLPSCPWLSLPGPGHCRHGMARLAHCSSCFRSFSSRRWVPPVLCQHLVTESRLGPPERAGRTWGALCPPEQSENNVS